MALLYRDLAPWWPLFSPPSEYDGEAEDVRQKIEAALGRAPATLLELGSGGGNIASYLRSWTDLTLSDLSPDMLAVSERLNPGVPHHQGDLRTLRLEKTFEAVLLHDAVMYMTSEDDLLAALTTARAHLAPGGVALVLPDAVTETYQPDAEVGGSDDPDGSGRGVRWLMWSHPLPPGGHVINVDFSLVLQEADGSVRSVHDRHQDGIFPLATWRELFLRAGFADVTTVRDPWREAIFLGRA